MNDQQSDELLRLQAWYAEQCNGDWEHQYGVRIGTLDNPGWSLDVDLHETVLEEQVFQPVILERNETDWVHCKVENGVFKARGGSRNLAEMVELFLAWSRNV